MTTRIGLVVVALAMSVGQAVAAPLTAKDMATLDRASDPRVSPDERYVAWNVRSTDWNENKGVNALWVLDRQTQDATPRQLVKGEKGAVSARWSADGRALYFLSARSGTAQVWRIAPDATDATQVTNLPLDIAFFKVSPDGRALVVTQDVYADCETLTCTKDKNDARAKEKVSGVLYEGRLPRFWDDFEDERKLNLFAVALGDTPATTGTALMRGIAMDIPEKPLGTDKAFDISPDGKTVFFSVRPSGASQGLGTPAKLYVAPIDGSAAPKVLNPASATSDLDPAVSPDGTTLAWRAVKTPTFAFSNAHLRLRDIASGREREIPLRADINFESIAWSRDGRTLYATGEDTGQQRIFAIDPASGASRALTADGRAADVSVGSNVLVYTGDTLAAPAQVFELNEGARPRQLSNVNADALKAVEFSAFEQFAFRGWNNETVRGYMVKPHNYRAGQKYPVAFLIHGGPHSSFGNTFSYRWNPQVWAGMGYAVVMIDFHGSTSYGEKFARSIIGHWGDRPLEDLRKGWAHALKTYSFLDGDRACALGGSYGGYMVSWMAGAWNAPFKCLVNHDGILDTRMMTYAADIPAFMIAHYQGSPWERPGALALERFNPARLVNKWVKPMLVIHGGRDYRVPLDQGIAAYTAAQLRGVPTQLLHFPDENHWVLKPQNSVHWYATVEKWMARWLNNTTAAANPTTAAER